MRDTRRDVWLAVSEAVHSDRCLRFPVPAFSDPPSGLLVVMGHDSGKTRLATATTFDAPADSTAVQVSSALAGVLRARASRESGDPMTAHLVRASVTSARARDILIHGEASKLKIWAALLLAAAAMAGAVLTLTTTTAGVGLAVSLLALVTVANLAGAGRDIAAAFKQEC